MTEVWGSWREYRAQGLAEPPWPGCRGPCSCGRCVAGTSLVHAVLISVPPSPCFLPLVGAVLCLVGNAITGTVGGLQVQS